MDRQHWVSSRHAANSAQMTTKRLRVLRSTPLAVAPVPQNWLIIEMPPQVLEADAPLRESQRVASDPRRYIFAAFYPPTEVRHDHDHFPRHPSPFHPLGACLAPPDAVLGLHRLIFPPCMVVVQLTAPWIRYMDGSRPRTTQGHKHRGSRHSSVSTPHRLRPISQEANRMPSRRTTGRPFGSGSHRASVGLRVRKGASQMLCDEHGYRPSQRRPEMTWPCASAQGHVFRTTRYVHRSLESALALPQTGRVGRTSTPCATAEARRSWSKVPRAAPKCRAMAGATKGGQRGHTIRGQQRGTAPLNPHPSGTAPPATPPDYTNCTVATPPSHTARPRAWAPRDGSPGPHGRPPPPWPRATGGRRRR